MTPDVYTQLDLLNATPLPLVSGSAGPGMFNQYQMASWFNFPNAPSPICATASKETYKLQFQRGVGDQDDGADLQLNLGQAADSSSAVAWLQARSDTNSGHFMQIQFQIPNDSIYAYAYSLNSSWNSASADQIVWGIPTRNTVNLNYSQNGAQALAIVDLKAVFSDMTQALSYFVDIVQDSLSPTQKLALVNAVNTYVKS